MKRVTGIGGIFFKCQDPAKMNEWYKIHLGLDTSPYGAKVPMEDANGYTLWTPFAATTKYFEPNVNGFMLNFRVENLAALAEELKKEGVSFVDELQDTEYGKFVHILDLEGNKIELWEDTAAE